MITIVVGLIADWLTYLLFRNRFGLIGNLLLGIVGSFIGGWLYQQLGVSVGGFRGSVFPAFIGSLVLLGIVNLFRGNW